MSSTTLLNIAFLVIAVIVAFIYLKRDHEREKANGNWLKWFHRYTKTAEFKQRNSYAAQYREMPEQAAGCPSFDRDDFELEDVALRAIEVLPEFPLPPLSAKRALKPGDHVLLSILSEKDQPGRPVWAQVNGRWEEDVFTGEIIGSAGDADIPHIGKEIVFAANHIALIERPCARPTPN